MGVLKSLCPPALVYVAFSLTHVVIDLFRRLYNTALMKLVVTVIITTMLEILCRMNLQAVSWLIVFIPLVALTVIAASSLEFLGLSPDLGKHKEGYDKQTHHNKPVHHGKHEDEEDRPEANRKKIWDAEMHQEGKVLHNTQSWGGSPAMGLWPGRG
jgi:hypothetical protein